MDITGGTLVNEVCCQKYSKELVNKVLNDIKTCVRAGKYTVSLNENRIENKIFIEEYNLYESKQKNILLGLKLEDFCCHVQNIKKGYENELLYIFAPKVGLYTIDGEEELISIYLKFNIIKIKGNNVVIVVSFHKLNKPITYAFI